MLDRPYAGGFITEHYGAPSAGVHGLQIEINRALYMNEATLEKNAGFEPLRHLIESLIHALVGLDPMQLAAPSISSEREAAE